MYKIYAIALLLCTGNLFAQTTVKVLNKNSGDPVRNAVVVSINEKKETHTNDKGEFKYSPLLTKGIEISHPNFKSQNFYNIAVGDKLYLEPLRITMPEVFVTGNPRLDPMQVQVSSNYRQKVTQPKNAGELFSDINGFSIIKRGNYAMDPSFRASQYEQLNVMFDGGIKAMQACPNRMDPITTLINPEEVEKIEIIKGPFSVRYGNSFAGMINMVTSKPKDTGRLINGTVSSGLESNGSAIVNHLQLEGVKDKYDYSLNFSHRDYNNYEDGNSREIPSAFRSLGYGIKLGYKLDENQRLQAGLRQSFGRDVLHAGLMMDTEEDNSTIANLDYIYKFSNSDLQEVTFKSYHSQVDHIMSNYRRPSFKNTEAISNLTATTYGGKVESKWKLGDQLTSFLGLDVYNLARDGSRVRTIKRDMQGNLLPQPKIVEDKVWQDSYVNNYGLFLESTYAINKKNIIEFGIRWDHVVSDSRDPDESFNALYPDLDKQEENYISTTASYRHLFSSNYQVDVSFGRGIRPANMEERFIAFLNIGMDPYEYVGNPYLKAEVNNQFEVGFLGKEQFTNAAVDLEFGANVYYSKYENYIVGLVDTNLTRKYMPAKDPKNPKVFQNIEDAFKTGMEIFARAELLKKFTLGAEMAYVYTENKDLGESLPLTPPLVSRFDLGYRSQNFWAELQYKVTAKQDRISKNFGESSTDGYATLDLNAGLTLAKNLKLGVGVLNIFDEYYNDHLSFTFSNQGDFTRTPITEPGRNFTAFLSYKF